MYDYEASAPGELTIKEDELLLVFDTDDEWLLVQSDKGGKAGYVPANYVDEDSSADSGAAPEIIIPDSVSSFCFIPIPPCSTYSSHLNHLPLTLTPRSEFAAASPNPHKTPSRPGLSPTSTPRTRRRKVLWV